MPRLIIKDLPRYECLLEASREFSDLDPSAAEVFLHLLHAGDEVFRVVQGNLARHEITQGRFGVLMALAMHERRGAESPPLTPAELAQLAGVTRATMTGLIDTLERDGLVIREPAPDDRRMTTVRVTPEARALLRRILPGHFQVMASLMEPLSVSERATLVRLLTKIVARAATIAPARGDAVPTSCAAK
jgi:DNA-binding MarR family transcriptional regulator